MKKLLLVGAFFGLLFCLYPTLKNEFRGRQISKQLTSAGLPAGAKIIAQDHRVYNGGNGDGCDFQGVVVVSYWGDVAPLREAFLKSLHAYAEQFNDPELQIVTTGGAERWGAKLLGQSTELHIRPNTDHSGLYLIDLTVAPRRASFDLRCL